MRGVSRSIRRVAAAFALAMLLLGHATTALGKDCTEPRDAWTRIIVWLQSRFTVPGG